MTDVLYPHHFARAVIEEAGDTRRGAGEPTHGDAGTRSDAHSNLVNVDDPADGHATIKVAIHVAKDSIHFIVNDRLATAIAKSQLNGASTDGQAGLRINHQLDIDVDWKGVSK